MSLDAWGMARRVQRIHMVGVAGAGMSGIAEVLVRSGYRVQGSDLRENEVTERLVRQGVCVFRGHAGDQVEEADVVVVSSAVGSDNPEVCEARRRGIPVIRRAEMLAELMRSKLGVAVAGSHGKTSTTSLIGAILHHAGMEPTVVVGGKINAVGSNAQLGAGGCLVAEADESDGSFLHLFPTVAVVTNVDPEHLDHYAGGMPELREAFRAFLSRLPFYGLAVVCADHPEVPRLVAELDRRVRTYGLSSQAELQARNVRFEGHQTVFEVLGPEGSRGVHRLRMLGLHNVQNALAALAVADELGVSAAVARDGLEAFSGVDRRFSLRGESNGTLVVDDYGHHPAEIEATLAGARSGYPNHRIIAVFQPHRYSRTAQLLEAFGSAFSEAAAVYVMPVYPAGEAPLPGVHHEAIVEALKRHGHRSAHPLAGLPTAAEELAPRIEPGDLVITFGAGDIGRLASDLLDLLSDAR